MLLESECWVEKCETRWASTVVTLRRRLYTSVPWTIQMMKLGIRTNCQDPIAALTLPLYGCTDLSPYSIHTPYLLFARITAARSGGGSINICCVVLRLAPTRMVLRSPFLARYPPWPPENLASAKPLSSPVTLVNRSVGFNAAMITWSPSHISRAS